ncbi:hypothetical protein J2808_000021 [Pseudarthrobacter sulfonivorans]|nr:hypothetical protein [Pseudarthrobacter sulfonivorans]
MAVMDIGGRVEADAGVLVMMYLSTNPLMNVAASWTEAKR